MKTIIGPRTIYYIDKDGSHQPISISMELGDEQTVDLGDGESATEKIGYVHINSVWFQRTMKALGSDDIQVMKWLIEFADAWLQRFCRDNKVQIFKIMPGDIVKDMDVFS